MASGKWGAPAISRLRNRNVQEFVNLQKNRYILRESALGKPIILNKVGKNSISLSGIFHSTVQRIFSSPVSILLDTGSAEFMFVRKSWAMANQLSLIPLPHPRPLYLADGCVSELITHRVIGFLKLGNHVEEVDALITTLGSKNDVILGFPWLERHNPSIDWRSKSVQFDKKFCLSNCLILRNSNYKAPNFKETPNQEYNSEAKKKETELKTKLALVSPIRARTVASKRVKQIIKNDHKKLYSQPKVLDKINPNDIRILKAPGFFQVTRQKDVQVMRITAKDLKNLGEEKETKIKVPDLNEKDYQVLLQGSGDPREWKTRFSKHFHDFIDLIFHPNNAKLGKITDEDVTIFFKKVNSCPPSMEEIRMKVPKAYHNIADEAFPQNATNLPPHRPYDHKTELLPGDHKFPRSRARPCSPSELRVIKRWLDDQIGRG